MVCRTLRLALLVGAVTAAVVSPARAFFRKAPCCCEPCGDPCAQAAPAPAPAPAAPAMRTICVTECVPERYTVKRTCYKQVCVQETYQACKTVCEREERTRTCNVVVRVPVTKTEARKVCKNVTCYEDRTVMKTEWRTEQHTCMKKELVRLGHWECREECASGLFSGCGLFGGGGCGLLGGGHGHGNGCCDSGCGDPCANACPPTRTKKVWVHCPEYCERPVTTCKKVCVQVPTVCKVAVCKQVWETHNVQVCTYECKTEVRTEKYCVMVPRTVTYTATRTVSKCVPYEVDVVCCRMVTRTREIQVPVCETPCNPCCESGGFFRGRFFGGHGGHGGGDSCCH